MLRAFGDEWSSQDSELSNLWLMYLESVQPQEIQLFQAFVLDQGQESGMVDSSWTLKSYGSSFLQNAYVYTKNFFILFQ